MAMVKKRQNVAGKKGRGNIGEQGNRRWTAMKMESRERIYGKGKEEERNMKDTN